MGDVPVVFPERPHGRGVKQLEPPGKPRRGALNDDTPRARRALKGRLSLRLTRRVEDTALRRLQPRGRIGTVADHTDGGVPCVERRWQHPLAEQRIDHRGGALPRLPDKEDVKCFLGKNRPQPATFACLDPL